MYKKNICLYFFTIFGFIAAEVINFRPCPNVGNTCTITEVRIDPCKENPKPCKFKKGTDASISFDFTPNFTASKLKTMVYWDNGGTEPEFLNFDGDGCKVTNCPTQPGSSQQYNYKMQIGRKLPSGIYPIKWKVWNEEDESQVCCFLATISLRR